MRHRCEASKRRFLRLLVIFMPIMYQSISFNVIMRFRFAFSFIISPCEMFAMNRTFFSEFGIAVLTHIHDDPP